MNIVFKKFIDLEKNEHISLLKIRNSPKVRLNTKSKKIIDLQNHLLWLNKIKTDNSNQYFAIFYNDIVVGSMSILSINQNKKECSWGLYFKENINPILSSLCTYILIDKIFNEMNIQRLTLEVEKINTQAYKFDLSFGFEVYDTINNYFHMDMTKEKWNKNKDIGYMKLLEKKVNKIQYKFI